jgi:hypothetical protein
MKRITVSLMAILAVALLGSPAFAANQMERQSMSSNWSASGDVVQNPMLTDTEGAGAFPAQENRQAFNRGERLLNPMLTDTEGAGAFPMRNHSVDENYGIAPAWGDRQGSTAELKLEDPRLQGVFENYE